jgi:hypothetical protein
MTDRTALAEIFIRFQREGWHYWPGAEGKREYLGSLHRHMFHVDVITDVMHDDREIEFHDLRDYVWGLWPHDGHFGGSSCEMIARMLADACASHFGRGFSVTVSEDGEFGAMVSVHV